MFRTIINMGDDDAHHSACKLCMFHIALYTARTIMTPNTFIVCEAFNCKARAWWGPHTYLIVHFVFRFVHRTSHGYAILAAVALYALVRFGIFNAGWERFHTYAFSVSVVVFWICYKTVLGHLEAGNKLDDKVTMVEMSRDCMYLLIFSMTTSLLSDSAWWIMMLIPTIALYKFVVGVFLPYMTAEPVEEPEIVLSKTQQKKQRRAEKFGRWLNYNNQVKSVDAWSQCSSCWFYGET